MQQTGGEFLIKKGCDPVTIYFLQTLHMGTIWFQKTSSVL